MPGKALNWSCDTVVRINVEQEPELSYAHSMEAVGTGEKIMQRIIILLAVLGLVLPNVASAKLYKCKDAEGQVVYTDQSCEGEGEELKLPPSVTYTPQPTPAISNTPETDTAAVYKKLEIVTPENDKLIISTQGIVNFSYKIEGPLLSVKRHKYGLELDGKKLKTRGITNQVRLDNIGPGTHTIRVFVADDEEKELISSAVVTFHMKRLPNSTSPSPGQPTGNGESVPGAFPGGGNAVPGGFLS